MQVLYLLALLVTSVVCLLGVLHPRYQDNLLQRLGMAVACLGAVAELWTTLEGVVRVNAHIVSSVGVALFAVGTVLKKVRGRFMRRRASDMKGW